MDTTEILNNTGSRSNESNILQRSFLTKLYISVEPIFFILFFAFSLTDAAGTNLILERTCTLVFGFSKKNCTGQLEPSIGNIIQPYTTRIIMGKSIIDAIIPAILSLYIGSWTDMYKRRKPFLIAPLIGATVTILFWLIFAYLPVPPIYSLLVVLPYSLGGGVVSLFTCGYAYLSDITDESNRSLRLSFCTITSAMGMLSGYLLSTEIYKIFHKNIYLIVYGTSLCSLICILLYTTCLLPEPLKNTLQSNERDEVKMRKSFFNLSHVKESISVLLLKRPSRGRCVLILLIAILVIDIFVLHGESGCRYLSLKASFAWTAEDYNIFSAVLSGSGVIAGIVGVFLLKKVLRFREPFIILLILAMSCISSTFLSLSKTPTQFYSAALLGCLVVVLNPFINTEITYLIPKSDIGKIFALISTLESLTPFAASPAYTELYNSVITYKPLYVNFLTAGLWLLCSILIIIIITIQSLFGRQYEQLDEEEDSITSENETDSTFPA